MKKSILTIALLIMAIVMYGQDKEESANGLSFSKGTKVAQVGLGLGGSLGVPIGASFEIGITDQIGVGGYAGFARKSFAVFGNEYSVNNVLIGARGHYHFYTTDKIDAYGGAILGYNAASAKWKTNSTLVIPASYGGMIWAGFVGGRYYLTEQFAAFAELGYGIGFLSVGAAMKF